MMRCKKCNYLMTVNVKFCPECGEPTDTYVNDRRRDDKNDDDDEGGILDTVGGFIGKLFGG